VNGGVRGVDGHGLEIVAPHLDAEVLLGGQPGHAGERFELEALEGFLDIPLMMPL
jgi:hypothetical protein